MTGELQIINKEILYGQVMVQIDDNDVEILMVQPPVKPKINLWIGACLASSPDSAT